MFRISGDPWSSLPWCLEAQASLTAASDHSRNPIQKSKATTISTIQWILQEAIIEILGIWMSHHLNFSLTYLTFVFNSLEINYLHRNNGWDLYHKRHIDSLRGSPTRAYIEVKSFLKKCRTFPRLLMYSNSSPPHAYSMTMKMSVGVLITWYLHKHIQPNSDKIHQYKSSSTKKVT